MFDYDKKPFSRKNQGGNEKMKKLLPELFLGSLQEIASSAQKICSPKKAQEKKLDSNEENRLSCTQNRI